MRRLQFAIATIAVLVLITLTENVQAAVTTAPEKPKSEFGALKFRAVGPAITGRVDRVAGVPGDPLT